MRLFVFNRSVRAAICALLAFTTTACYVNRPLTTSLPSPGQRVFVRLTDQGSIDLARYIGPGMVAVDGTVESAADGEIALRVLRTEQRNGVDVSWAQEPVTVPRSAIASIEERSLDKRRSWMVAGLLGGLVVAVGILIGTGVLSGGAGEDDPGPQ
jgi:hypothetical protein